MTRPKEKGHAHLSDLLTWGAFVAPGVVLNKDGSLQTTWRFRGPDLDSTTTSGLVATMARVNNAIRRLSSGWAVHIEARRRTSDHYPDIIQDPAAAWLIDHERHFAFAQSGTKFLTDYYLTFSYLVPEDRAAKATGWMFENKPKIADRQIDEEIDTFREQVASIVNLLGTILPMVAALDDAETLTYLHDCVSWSKIHVRPPDELQLIDSFLYDTDLLPGLEPMLGDQWIKMLAVQSFPSSTVPALLDRLNCLPFEYRWTSRYLCLDKRDSEAELNRKQRQWFAKRKSLGRLLMEMISKQESGLVNTDALNKADDANDALTELAEDLVSFGFFTPVITVWDKDLEVAKEKLALVQREVDGLGFVSKVETFNSVDAWLSTLPGQNFRNVRRPLVSTLNLSHMLPLSAVWSGEQWNQHLNAPALFVGETDGATPFYMNLHTGDVGHCMMIGPTGGGKSTFLAFLASQWLRYQDSKVMIFDKGGSARAMSHAVGGHYCQLGDPSSMTLQPPRRRRRHDGTDLCARLDGQSSDPRRGPDRC